MSVIQTIKNIGKKVLYRDENFYSRYKDGCDDLAKGLQRSEPITQSQKNEIMAFWKPYLNNRWTRKTFDIRWFDVYNKTNVFDFPLKYYIPDSFYYCIVDGFLSNEKSGKVLDDKNMYDLYFYDVKQPKTICRKVNDVFLDSAYHVITKQRAVELCVAEDNVIIKSSVDACAGRGIYKWSKHLSDSESLGCLLDKGHNYIVQQMIKQHQTLAAFNDTCVNTLRLVTLYFEGKIHLCSAVLIAGGKNAVTNHLHGGGIVCGIHSNGLLYHTAFDGKLNQYTKHPNGVIFSECRIPEFDKCIEMVKRLAARFLSAAQLISWDLTINEEGEPILIETNLVRGGVVQIAAGPVFGSLTPKVLDYIATRYK